MDGVERARLVARQRRIRLLCRAGIDYHAVSWRGGCCRSRVCSPSGVPAGCRALGSHPEDAGDRAGFVPSRVGPERAGAERVLAERRRVAQGNAVTGAVFFDFNGVLVDDEAPHCPALQAVVRDEGITLSREEYYAHYLGVDDRAGFVQAYRRANRTLTSAQLQRLVEAKSQLYQQLIRTSLEIVAGVPGFVAAAAERVCVALLARGR